MDDLLQTKTDIAFSDVLMRKRICKDIVGSGFFQQFNFVSLSKRKVFRKQNDPRYMNAFHRLFTYTEQNKSFQYTNIFRPLKLEFSCDDDDPWEDVFFCPMKHLRTGRIVTFAVTKEYNVATMGLPYKPGRFVLGSISLELPNYENTVQVMLAEEPANIFKKSNFNIELHYLQLRKHIQPTRHNYNDPLCKLVSKRVIDHSNQHHRLCVAVSRSSRFVNKIKYPRSTNVKGCEEIEVSFRTKIGLEKAANGTYYERVALCYSLEANRHKKRSYLYISRAYKSNQIFVYRFKPSDGRMYLENLMTNVSIIDELNSFDFVED